MKLFLKIFLIFISFAPMLAQSFSQPGVWFRFKDDINNEKLFENYYDSTSDSLSVLPIISNSLYEPHTIYWDGNEWVTNHNNISHYPFYILIPVSNSSMRIALSANPGNGSYDIFTDEGWIHIDNSITYNFEEDYIHFDEENNRLILFKQNIPWMFYLKDENELR